MLASSGMGKTVDCLEILAPIYERSQIKAGFLLHRYSFFLLNDRTVGHLHYLGVSVLALSLKHPTKK